MSNEDTMDNEFTRGCRELFQTGDFSDLTLICGDREFKVHKFPLYTQSAYFKKLLGSGFKEGKERTIALHDDDPEALDVLIHYLYRHRIDINSTNTKPMTRAVEIYGVADKYTVPSLCALAAKRFNDVLDPTADLDDFITAIKTIDSSVYSGDRTLWDTVIRVTRKNISFLLCQDDFVTLLGEMPNLNTGLLRLLDPSTESESVGVVDPVYVGPGGGRRLG